MTRNQRSLGYLLGTALVLTLAVAGCDNTDASPEEGMVAPLAGEEAGAELDEASSPAPVAEGGCNCGHFIDEDGNGVCDLMESGECRRGRDGRCPCSQAADGGGTKAVSPGGCAGDCGRGPGFVDEDGDGVCDHAGERGHGHGFVDEDGDGVCDHAGERGHGPGFVDEDGDGACDHAGERGRGHGWRGGRGHGPHGPGFADEDGDGACDHAGERGRGHGWRGGRGQGQGQGQGLGNGWRWRHVRAGLDG